MLEMREVPCGERGAYGVQWPIDAVGFWESAHALCSHHSEWLGAEMHNRWGKLPVTIYPENYTEALPIQEMSFTKAPGRSYRYFQGEALFKFG